MAHPSTGVEPYKLCNIADVGDAPVNRMKLDASIQMITDFLAKLKALDIRPVTIGGDHMIPTPILRALAADGPVGLLQIDNHADVLDEMRDTKINHATFMRRAHEDKLIDPDRTVHLGLRGSRFVPEDIQYGIDAGFTVLTMDDYEDMRRAATIAKIREVIGEGPMYITIDIDGLDPSYCPGTAVSEIGGIIPRDVQKILQGLMGFDVIGADAGLVPPSRSAQSYATPNGLGCGADRFNGFLISVGAISLDPPS